MTLHEVAPNVESYTLFAPGEMATLPTLPDWPGYYILRDPGTPRARWTRTDGLTFRLWFNTILVH